MVCCYTAVLHLRPTEVIDWFGHVECSHLVCSNVVFFFGFFFFPSSVNSKCWLNSYSKQFRRLNNPFSLRTNWDLKEFGFACLDFMKVVILCEVSPPSLYDVILL